MSRLNSESRAGELVVEESSRVVDLDLDDRGARGADGRPPTAARSASTWALAPAETPHADAGAPQGVPRRAGTPSAGRRGSRQWRDRSGRRPGSRSIVIAASTTWRAIGPAVSCSAEMGTTPDRLTSPSVGLWPTTPFAPAGQTIEPSVSVPIATWASAAATAAPDPDWTIRTGCGRGRRGCWSGPPTALHPLVEQVRRGSWPTRTGSPCRGSTAPAERSRRTSSASLAGRLPSSARDPAVSRGPSVSMLSLSSTGMPSSWLRGPWVCRYASLAAASAAAAGFSFRIEFTSSSSARMRRR